MKKTLKTLGAWTVIAVGIGLLTAGVIQKSRTIEVDHIDTKKNNVEAQVSNLINNTIVTSKVKAEKIDLSEVDAVTIFTEIDSLSVGKAVSELDKQCTVKSDRPVYLLLDSPGGSVLDGVKVIAAIEACQRPVYTVNMGLSASMAAMIHSYGAKRLVTPRSILMYHNASGQVQGEFPKMVSRLTTIGQVVTKMEMNVAKRSNIKLEDYRRKATDELWIDSDQALEQKFADEVIYISNLPTPEPTGALNKNKTNKNITPKSDFNITW